MAMQNTRKWVIELPLQVRISVEGGYEKASGDKVQGADLIRTSACKSDLKTKTKKAMIAANHFACGSRKYTVTAYLVIYFHSIHCFRP